MSFWSTLGKIGLGVGGAVAAPFTGGASLIPVLAGAAGSMLSSGAQAAASNRGTGMEASLAEENVNQQRRSDFIEQWLAREQEGRASGNDAFRNMQRAEYLSGAKGYTPRAGLKSFG